jgi:hypothetical protein
VKALREPTRDAVGILCPHAGKDDTEDPATEAIYGVLSAEFPGQGLGGVTERCIDFVLVRELRRRLQLDNQ